MVLIVAGPVDWLCDAEELSKTALLDEVITPLEVELDVVFVAVTVMPLVIVTVL